MFQIGDIVRVIYTMLNDKFEKGAIAKVVDGEKNFPQYWDQLKQQFQDDSFNDITWVVWDKKNPHYKGALDGAYLDARFVKTNDEMFGFNEDIIEPKNNDGRNLCFKCNTKTEIKQGFNVIYNICPKCKI